VDIGFDCCQAAAISRQGIVFVLCRWKLQAARSLLRFGSFLLGRFSDCRQRERCGVTTSGRKHCRYKGKADYRLPEKLLKIA